MSVETREYCDLCDRDLTHVRGMSIYRGRFRRFWHWISEDKPRGSVTICGSCWNKLASAIRKVTESEAREFWDVCHHGSVSERPKYAIDDEPGHYLCLDCGDKFPLIGDTDKWKPKAQNTESRPE